MSGNQPTQGQPAPAANPLANSGSVLANQGQANPIPARPASPPASVAPQAGLDRTYLTGMSQRIREAQGGGPLTFIEVIHDEMVAATTELHDRTAKAGATDAQLKPMADTLKLLKEMRTEMCNHISTGRPFQG